MRPAPTSRSASTIRCPDVADPPALTAGYVTFGCLASQYKITPPVVETWARILRRSPRAKLLLKNAALAHGADGGQSAAILAIQLVDTVAIDD